MTNVVHLPEPNAVTIVGPTGHDIVQFVFYDDQVLLECYDGQQLMGKKDIKDLRHKLKRLEAKLK